LKKPTLSQAARARNYRARVKLKSVLSDIPMADIVRYLAMQLAPKSRDPTIHLTIEDGQMKTEMQFRVEMGDDDDDDLENPEEQ